MAGVTVNPNVRAPGDCTHVRFEKVLERFGRDENGIQELRGLSDPEEQNRRKMELPVVVFGGTFKARSNKDLIEASGLICLDFDCESKAQSEKIHEIISTDEYVH